MFKLCPTLLPKFKGFCSSPSVIMLFVYMKCRFSLSYRELEEMMMIRGAMVDHSTLQRWVKRFVSLIDSRVRARKKPVNGSWRMDETYLLEGDLKEAGLLLQNALTTMEQVQHPDAYRVLETLADLESKKAALEESRGNTSQTQIHKAQAKAYLNKALDIAKTHLPEESSHIRRIQSRI